MSELTATRGAFGQTTIESAENNGKVMVLDTDLAKATMSRRFKGVYPDRLFGMGITECDLVETATGLSATGETLFTYTLVVFAAGHTFEQIRSPVAYPYLNARICGSHDGISIGKDDATRQAVEDLAVMAVIPSMVVLNLGDTVEMRVVVKAMIDYDGPVYTRLGHNPVPVIFDPDTYYFQIGKGIKIREGKDVTLVAAGSLLNVTNQAAEKLLAEGVQAEAISTATIKPLDKDLVVEFVRKTWRVVVLEEGTIAGRPGSAVARALSEQYPVPICYIGIGDYFGQSGDSTVLMEHYGMTAEGIIHKAKELL